MVAAAPTTEVLWVSLQAFFGDANTNRRQLLKLSWTDQTPPMKVNFIGRDNINLAAGAADVAFALTQLLPAAASLYYLSIKDIGGGGLKVALGAGQTKFSIAPGGALALTWDSAIATPTLYLTNTDGANIGYAEIAAAGKV